VLKKVDGMFSKINSAIALIGAMLIFMLMLYCFAGVVGRYLLGRYFLTNPVQGVDEYSGLMMVLIIFLGMAWTLEQKGHIAIDIFPKRLGKKRPFLAEALSIIPVAVAAFFLLWKGFDLALSKLHIYSSTRMEIWLFPYYCSVPIGGLLLLIQCIRMLFSSSKVRQNLQRRDN
jgi:TRAP-type C4-dicarboxylate transport system permease small subunit